MKRIRVTKKNGNYTYSESLREVYDKMPDGDYSNEIKKWSGAKTWSQIKALQGVIIPGISEYTGETIQEVKRRLKLDYGEVEYFEKDGETYVELKSYSSYTKAQMRDHIDKVLYHCEYDLDFIIDLETRKKLQIDYETGELTAV